MSTLKSDSPGQKVLVLFAHPAIHKSRVNKILLEKIIPLENIRFHNLYESYPDFHLDVRKEQNLLREHDIIVWQHPFYWYSAPAMIKEWIDLVLEHGFAYGKKGKALQGKSVFNAITAGGRKEAYMEGGYNNFTIEQFLAPYKQTARLCGMNYLPPFVIHGTHLLTEDEIERYAEDYKTILLSLGKGIFTPSDLMKYTYMNEILELNDKK